MISNSKSQEETTEELVAKMYKIYKTLQEEKEIRKKLINRFKENLPIIIDIPSTNSSFLIKKEYHGSLSWDSITVVDKYVA